MTECPLGKAGVLCHGAAHTPDPGFNEEKGRDGAKAGTAGPQRLPLTARPASREVTKSRSSDPTLTFLTQKKNMVTASLPPSKSQTKYLL